MESVGWAGLNPSASVLLASLVFLALSLISACGLRRKRSSLTSTLPLPPPTCPTSAAALHGCEWDAAGGPCDFDALLPFFDSPSGRRDDQPWRLVSATSALPLRVYHHADGHAHLLRAFAPLDAPTSAVLACAREIDLVPSWNPFVRAAELLDDIAPTRVRAAVSLWTPPPLPRASIVVDALLVDRLDATPTGTARDGPCALIVAASPEPHVPLASLPAALRGWLQLPVEAVCRLVPRADGGTDVEMVSRLPAAHVPSLLVDTLIYMVAPRVYRAALRMLRTALADGAPLARRISDGPQRELYAQLEARCARLRAAARAAGGGLCDGGRDEGSSESEVAGQCSRADASVCAAASGAAEAEPGARSAARVAPLLPPDGAAAAHWRLRDLLRAADAALRGEASAGAALRAADHGLQSGTTTLTRRSVSAGNP